MISITQKSYHVLQPSQHFLLLAKMYEDTVKSMKNVMQYATLKVPLRLKQRRAVKKIESVPLAIVLR